MSSIFTIIPLLGGDGEIESELTEISNWNKLNEEVFFFLGDGFGAVVGERGRVIVDPPRGVGRGNPSGFDRGKFRDDPRFEGGEGVAANNCQLHNGGGVMLFVEIKQASFHVNSKAFGFFFEGEKVSCSEVGVGVFLVYLGF